jgi:hypothetical protein
LVNCDCINLTRQAIVNEFHEVNPLQRGKAEFTGWC